jgi:ribosome-associated protein
MENAYKILLQKIVSIIQDKKGCDVVALDVSEFSSITDCILIAQGNIERHVTAIANAIKKEMKILGITPYKAEGVEAGNWAVLDYRQVIVHLFKPEQRARYRLEELWSDGKEIELEASSA